ncbi:SDR family oxidoreductase [Streptomyces olindensis]|uniref:SDR family oxidoreductase n=1 Tax=Streptomyces olindensis TaxID=358823 RepID=A0ABV2Y9T8_9ACTN
MKAVVHRGARTREIESRAAEAPALGREWRGRDVNVNAIAPGCIATDDTEALRADPRRDQTIPGRIPAGRCRRAGDLARATVFFASPASDYVNATVLPVDGGWLGR